MGWDGMITRRSLLQIRYTTLISHLRSYPARTCLRTQTTATVVSARPFRPSVLFCSIPQVRTPLSDTDTRTSERPRNTTDGPARRYNIEGTWKEGTTRRRMTHRLANPRGHARPAPPSTSRVVVADALLCLLCLVRAGPPPEASRQWHPPRPVP